jgi:hypothetical protein
MTKIINALTIQAKVEEAFDEFRTRFNPERLYQAITDLATMAGRSVQFCGQITQLIGDDEFCLEQVDITGLPLGTTIMVPFGSSLLSFTLTGNSVLQSVAPYIIKAPDLANGDSRSWIRTGSLFSTFAQDALDENGVLKVDHNLGFPFFHLLVFDNQHLYRPTIVYSPDPEATNTSVLVSINQGFEGNWSLLITY